RHAVEDRERQRQADRHPRALSLRRLDLEAAVDRLDVLADDVHADAAAGHVGDLLGRRESRRADELPDVAVARILRNVEAALGRLGEDPLPVQARAVVRDLDDDVPALMRGAQAQRAGARLAGAHPRFRLLDAVIDRIADDMRQGIDELFDDAFVELGLLALENEVDLLAQHRREIAHEPRKTAEYEVDRDHADAEHRFLQLARVALELREALPQPLEVHGVEFL